MKATSAASVPYAVTDPTRIPAKRYYDQAFYDLEVKNFWPRVWQLACRLEEIPNVGDWVEYKNLGQSFIVVRTAPDRIKAYYNACRHRGMKLANDRGNARQGFSCPFHGWRFSIEGENTFLYQPDLFTEANRDPADLRLREVRVETWGGAAFINQDDNAAPLKQSLEPFASYHDAKYADRMRIRWWYSAIVPANWKLTMEAFMEGYHVMRTHPQFMLPGANMGEGAVYKPKGASRLGSATSAQAQRDSGGSRGIIEGMLYHARTSHEGMDSTILEKDIVIMESLRDTQLPDDPAQAFKEWRRVLGEAMTREHRKNGIDVPDYSALASTTTANVHFCFPNFFYLGQWGNLASYRFRPLGPESCLFDMWSLTLFPEGQEPKGPIKTPEPMAFDDPRWPRLPRQDFANVPLQQEGVRSGGVEYLRLSSDVEGLISHLHQALDGYLAGLPYDELIPAVQKVSGPIDEAIKGKFFNIQAA